MNAKVIEQRGVVQRVDGGQAFVALARGGCSGCAHSCGIGQLASGRAAPLLPFEVAEGCDIEVGDQVDIVLRESYLTASALVGYLFPAFAMLLGAWAGATVDGSDGGAALGAIAGFLAALVVVRLVIRLAPGLLPGPRLIHLPQHSNVSQQEFHHER